MSGTLSALLRADRDWWRKTCVNLRKCFHLCFKPIWSTSLAADLSLAMISVVGVERRRQLFETSWTDRRRLCIK